MRQPKGPLQESKGDGQVDGGTPHGPGLHEPLQTKGNVADIDQSGSAAISQSANDEIKEAEEVVSTSLIFISITRWCPRYCG